jgi:hypothetical protein
VLAAIATPRDRAAMPAVKVFFIIVFIFHSPISVAQLPRLARGIAASLDDGEFSRRNLQADV